MDKELNIFNKQSVEAKMHLAISSSLKLSEKQIMDLILLTEMALNSQAPFTFALDAAITPIKVSIRVHIGDKI